MKDATLRGADRVALKLHKAAEARHCMSKLESVQEGSECPLHGPVKVNYNLPWRLQYVSDARSMRLSIKESYRHGEELVERGAVHAVVGTAREVRLRKSCGHNIIS